MQGRPLRATTYLFRNAGKTIPLAAVLVLAVMLVSGIVSLIDSIPLSIKTTYDYSRLYMGVTPRGDPEMTPKHKEIIEKEAPVPIDRLMTVRGTDINIHSIVGPWPFLVIALNQGDMRYYLHRMGGDQLEGRFPKEGEPEALVSEPVARNLHLHIGSILLSPNDTDAYSPKEVRIVGISHATLWVAMMSLEYFQMYHFPPIDSLVVFAKNGKDQSILDHWAVERFKGDRARVFAYHELEKQTNSMFDILYTILDVVIFMLVIVITIMMGMLINIFLSQRVQEFGLLQALGYTKSSILKRVLTETTLVVAGGWALGVLAAILMLNIVKATLMEPHAFALEIYDKVAFYYTIPIPIAIFAVASLTIIFKFRKFDPVGIVERRLI